MMNNKLKISFDFDGTLTIPAIQRIAKFFVDSGADVWIVTARYDDNFYSKDKGIMSCGIKFPTCVNEDLRRISNLVGISKEKVIYTKGALKREIYFKEKFDMHYDDMYYEVEEINKYGGTAVLVDMRTADLLDEMNNYYRKD